MQIFHLDAGRKYFSVPVIRQLLDTMARTGFTHLQLYFSDNQGFRFGLEDMTLTTPYGVYDLASTLGDGYCEGPKSPSGDGGWLTVADMEEILAYAGQKGIGLIPLLNMPGHMGCILEKFPHLRYPGSRSSIDLDNPEAVAFALGLLEKYADFFAARGCKFFHFGADEYANDIAPGYPEEIIMGFDRIYHQGELGQFATFLNACCQVVTDRGMIPMAFNDGVYYGDDPTGWEGLDPRLLVCCWTEGWQGYRPGSVSFLSQQGLGLINADQRYYCGVGAANWQEKVRTAATFDPHRFCGDTCLAEPAGSMLCLWSDRGSADGQDGGATVARQLVPVMEAFGEAVKKRN